MLRIIFKKLQIILNYIKNNTKKLKTVDLNQKLFQYKVIFFKCVFL